MNDCLMNCRGSANTPTYVIVTNGEIAWSLLFFHQTAHYEPLTLDFHSWYKIHEVREVELSTYLFTSGEQTNYSSSKERGDNVRPSVSTATPAPRCPSAGL